MFLAVQPMCFQASVMGSKAAAPRLQQVRAAAPTLDSSSLLTEGQVKQVKGLQCFTDWWFLRKLLDDSTLCKSEVLFHIHVCLNKSECFSLALKYINIYCNKCNYSQGDLESKVLLRTLWKRYILVNWFLFMPTFELTMTYQINPK